MRAETAALPFLRREPAAILTAVQTALTLIVTLGVHLSDGWQSLILGITGATLAAITGWRVAPSRPALILGVVQALAPVIVLVGLHIPGSVGSVVLAIVTVILGALTRGQVSPAEVGRPFRRG